MSQTDRFKLQHNTDYVVILFEIAQCEKNNIAAIQRMIMKTYRYMHFDEFEDACFNISRLGFRYSAVWEDKFERGSS